MAVRLHFQSTGTVPGNARPVVMAGRSLTVGRGPDNDLVLPDPGKVISKHHVVIEDQNGNLVVIDLSTNGTFLNYGKAPLGRVPTPINDGDILTLGSYELMVEVTEDTPRNVVPPPLDDLAPPPAGGHPADLLEGPDDHADFLDELLGDARPSGPSSVRRPEPGDDGLLPPLGEDDLLGPAPVEPAPESASWHEHGTSPTDSFRPSAATDFIPDDWASDLMPPEPGAPPAEAEPQPQDPFAEPEQTIPPPPRVTIPPASAAPPPPAPSAPASAATREDAAARAFLEALGAPAVPDEELEQAMARLGQMMRTLIHGLREILMTRAAIKSEFRIRQTVIGRSGNNPLKFSVSPEQAVEALVRPRSAGYLDPVEATEQALEDIKAHEVAMMTGMEAALKGILQQLAPEALESQIRARRADMLKSRKALYWEAYEQLYARISDQAEKEFHELFSREFARAYQAQMERLK